MTFFVMAHARLELELREHATARGVALTAEDADALAASAARLSVVRRLDGSYDVSAKQVVGVVQTRRVQVLIRPKVELEGFFELLQEGLGLMRFDAEATVQPWRRLLPAMALLYARGLTRALRRGLLQGYQERRAPLAHVRGKVDGLHLATRRFGVVPPIDCLFQEYTPDTEMNQRLKAAAEFLIRSGFADCESERLLRSATGRMRGVLSRQFRPPVRPLVSERRFVHYRQAIGLADLVLNSASVDLRHGDVSSVGFLVNMDDLYEAWVAAALGRTMGLGAARWRRHPGYIYFDHDRLVKLEPDILWSNHAGARVPIDAKYKRGSRVPNPDIYQMASYCAALGSTFGVLLCTDVDPYTVRLKHGVTIYVLRLSVSGGPAARDQALESVASTLEGLGRTTKASATLP